MPSLPPRTASPTDDLGIALIQFLAELPLALLINILAKFIFHDVSRNLADLPSPTFSEFSEISIFSAMVREPL